MSLADTMLRPGTRRWSAKMLTSGIGAVGCGILFGFVLLVVAQRPTRWLVFMLVGLLVVVVTLAGQVRRQLIAYFTIGLSLNVHYYITQPEPFMFLGISGPTWFSIPLVLIPAGALAVMAMLDAIAGKAHLKLGQPVFKAAFFVLATSTVATLLSGERRFGIYYVVEMSQYVFLFLVVVNTVRSEHDVSLVLRMLLVTLAIQALVFLMQTATGVAFTLTGEVSRATNGEIIRASGTVGTTPSGYAMFIEPILFTSLALWRTRDCGISTRWTAFLVAMGCVTLVLTENRTSWMTLIVASCVVEILCRRRGIARELSGKLIASMIAAGVLAAAVVIPLIIPRLHENHGDDWAIRKNLMEIAIRMIKAHPIFGVGPGAYPFHLKEFATGNAAWLWVVHNEYLLIWAERGIFGLLAWLAWMRSGLRQALLASKTASPQFQALGIGVFAGLIGLMWEYALNMFPPYSCYALLSCLFGLLVAGNDIYANADTHTDGAEPDVPLRAAVG